LAEALELKNVNALYGDSHVLHGVSLILGEGRLLALLGRNGAEQTTCINAVI
jgi:branched-chain amino acid transport system ATP-binding protein